MMKLLVVILVLAVAVAVLRGAHGARRRHR